MSSTRAKPGRFCQLSGLKRKIALHNYASVEVKEHSSDILK